MAAPYANPAPAIDPISDFKRILLATDFGAASDAAFKTAVRVCTELHASLTILHVFEYADSVVAPGDQLLEVERIRDQARRSLNNCVEIAKAAGLTVEAVIENGMAVGSILETIQHRQIDLAIIGTNALHGFERTIFGSTAEEVLRQASCPVLTVGPQAAQVERSSFEGPIVFATDFHRTTKDAIRYAASLCERTKSHLHCLHILPRTVQTGSQSAMIPHIMTEALRQMASESHCTIDNPEYAIGYGSEISNAVVDYARQHKAGLIVLGVRQASMVAAHAPAHIAFRIITEAPCPVLTIGFASRESSMLQAAVF
jgi:nucleotide-binding universal stress UspA family protein